MYKQIPFSVITVLVHAHQAPTTVTSTITQVNAICDFLYKQLQYRYVCVSKNLSLFLSEVIGQDRQTN
jgi:hypothetical protein